MAFPVIEFMSIIFWVNALAIFIIELVLQKYVEWQAATESCHLVKREGRTLKTNINLMANVGYFQFWYYLDVYKRLKAYLYTLNIPN